MKLEEKILDKEWQELILLALNAGMTVEEIKEFLHKTSRPE
ncbi:DNA-binding anti-repressor SinI [Metabacillus fastidiosus]|nr:DNA-binding anti-repressor SinI [Metabacillus fastidiosus]MED4531166.1 DNA-binding anti-repressor SinI [Metabacillus fastidiosus]